MRYQTSISSIKDGVESIRGTKLTELIESKSFAYTVYLLLKGEAPSAEHERMFNALLVAAVDHGPGTASAQTARITASSKNSMHTSIAAGILAMGDLHGSAIEHAARFFETHQAETNLPEVLANLKAEGIRVPGFGHAVLTIDHRAYALLELAESLGLAGKYCTFAGEVFTQINAIASKPLPLNIDGAMAAILLDLGFEPGLMKGIFILSRTAGLVAQVHEEVTQNNGLRRVPESEIDYLDHE